MHILLAEDDLSTQLLVRRVLERHGHYVAVVGNGSDAVEAMEYWRFDVVLMDIQMPVMDGFAATVKIREREQFEEFRTPIIAFTSIENSEMFLEAGMDGYLGKPANAESLLAAVQAAAALSAGRDCSSH